MHTILPYPKVHIFAIRSIYCCYIIISFVLGSSMSFIISCDPVTVTVTWNITLTPSSRFKIKIKEKENRNEKEI